MEELDLFMALLCDSLAWYLWRFSTMEWEVPTPPEEEPRSASLRASLSAPSHECMMDDMPVFRLSNSRALLHHADDTAATTKLLNFIASQEMELGFCSSETSSAMEALGVPKVKGKCLQLR
mmetsp:Transcript_13195/g.30848  ORF Transcript_13195/g.30848 Transcript_13195/m.30848 type:complete len:121 (+) Transcript_13195:1098-1460(+)